MSSERNGFIDTATFGNSEKFFGPYFRKIILSFTDFYSAEGIQLLHINY